MTATAADYAWVSQWIDGLSQAYCLTLARGLTPAQFLVRLGAQIAAPSRTGAELSQPSFEIWDRYHGEALFIGATTVRGAGADWVLGLEVNGYLGVTPAAIVPVSAGTRVVSHHQNVEAADNFYWIEDRDIRLYFQPGSPAWREGSTPDALVGVMRQAGFDLRVGAGGDAGGDVRTAAAFALAEYLTGVRLTPELLDDSSYLCGVAPVPA
jgi:Family of unknown function (DUF6461)